MQAPNLLAGNGMGTLFDHGVVVVDLHPYCGLRRAPRSNLTLDVSCQNCTIAVAIRKREYEERTPLILHVAVFAQKMVFDILF